MSKTITSVESITPPPYATAQRRWLTSAPLASTLERWICRRIEQRLITELKQLDDRLLRDIGFERRAPAGGLGGRTDPAVQIGATER